MNESAKIIGTHSELIELARVIERVGILILATIDDDREIALDDVLSEWQTEMVVSALRYAAKAVKP